MVYQSKFTGQEIDDLLTSVAEGTSGGSGAEIDPELLEAFIPLSRDFSDDFNNDFAR